MGYARIHTLNDSALWRGGHETRSLSLMSAVRVNFGTPRKRMAAGALRIERFRFRSYTYLVTIVIGRLRHDDRANEEGRTSSWTGRMHCGLHH